LLAAALRGLFWCNAVLLAATVVRLLTFALTSDLGWGSAAVYAWEALSFAAVLVQYRCLRVTAIRSANVAVATQMAVSAAP